MRSFSAAIQSLKLTISGSQYSFTFMVVSLSRLKFPLRLVDTTISRLIASTLYSAPPQGQALNFAPSLFFLPGHIVAE